MIVGAVAGVVTFAAVAGWNEWRIRLLYGPIVPGNARWRRERRRR